MKGHAMADDPKKIKKKIVDTSKMVFTIPNMITFVRILVIPVFIWTYLKDYLIVSLLLVIFSALTDTFDGIIARRFHQVSNLGKWLDPVADKLSQMALAILMFFKFLHSADIWMHRFAWVFLLFIAKEVFMLGVGLALFILKLRPAPAAIWGKLATVVFYVIMAVLFLAGPDVGVLAHYLNWALPRVVAQGLVLASLLLTFVALGSYFPDTLRQLFGDKKKEQTK
jgi:cardiolipin synthase